MSELDDLDDIAGDILRFRAWSPRRNAHRLAATCINGHPYDPSNTDFIMKAGKRTRRCRTCYRKSMKRSHA